MAELEEKLNAILGNQEAMSQIMALARSFSGGSEVKSSTQQEEPQPLLPNSAGENRQTEGANFFEAVDPALLQLGMKLFKEYQGDNDRNTALLAALRPFLREERRTHLDKALELARMTRLIRTALSAMGGKGAEEDV